MATRLPELIRKYQDSLLAEWIAQEHLCCPFFEIELRLEPEGGPAWMRLTGREGTKQFIQADASAWLK